MKKIYDYLIDKIFNTKFGHFLFIVIFCFFFNIIISYITDITLFNLMFGSIIIAILLSIFDDNEKWI